ncbi:MAG: RNA-guided endonuclease IscB [Moorellales bacterium]
MTDLRNCVNTVAVLNGDGRPLSPTRPSRARWLLKRGRAKVVNIYPFVIRLTYTISSPAVNRAVLVLDDGETFGLAVVEHCSGHDRVPLAAEGKIRGREVSDNLRERRDLRAARRSRRNRRRGRPGEAKLAYRHGTEYPASIRADVQAKLNAVVDVLRWFPVSRIILEPVKVDLVKERRPGVRRREYQQGPASGVEAGSRHEKRRLAVLKRDGYRCLCCGSEVTEETARIHHFRTRKSGGTDRYDVVGTLCEKCHRSVKTEKLALVFDPGRFPDPRAAGRCMHGRCLLEEGLKSFGLPVEVRYGYETKEKREKLNLPKSHVNDAAALGARDGCKLRSPAVFYRVEYRRRHANRKLFNANPGVAHYRAEADRQPGVDRERMVVDDHDQEANRKNRSYRRHVRNRYYRKLRAEGRFNYDLLPGKKHLNEAYAVNEAVYVGLDGRPVVVKNRRIWREQDLTGLPPRSRRFEKGDLVRTREGWPAKVISLMSDGQVKVLFCEKKEGRKHQFTERHPAALRIMQKGRGRCWVPQKVALLPSMN